MYSWYFFRHCIATDEVLFNNQKFLDNFVKKNQTWIDAIEEDCYVYLNLNKKKNLPPEYEAVFKRDYKKYLNNLEDIVQNYQDVFFYGYFTIVNDKDGPEILQILKDLHKNKTEEVLAISFKDKRPFEVVVENKKLQQTIGKHIFNKSCRTTCTRCPYKFLMGIFSENLKFARN